MPLWLKRIVLLGLVVVITTFLAILQIQANQEVSKLQHLLLNRPQKQDYTTLFDRSIYKKFRIEFTEETFTQLMDNMQAYYDLFGNYRDNQMVKVNVHYEDATGSSFVIHEAGFRTKSNTSRNLPLTLDWRGRKVYHQTSFQIQFNATHDYLENSNEYVYLNQREAFDLRQLNFEFAWPFEGNQDEALITEAIAHDYLRQAGLVAQNASYGIVYFTIGETTVGFGLYSLIEPVDSTFIKRHFGIVQGNAVGDLYKATDIDQIKAHLGPEAITQRGLNINEENIRFQYALANNSLLGTRTDFSKFDQWIQAINQENVFLQNPTRYLNVDQLLRFLAINHLIGNTDDFRFNGNNYYLYFHPITNQAWIIPFDFDNSLGFGRNKDPQDLYMTKAPLFFDSDQENTLLRWVLNNPSYRAIYVDYLEVFLEQIFSKEKFLDELTQAQNLYQDELIMNNHLGIQVFGTRNIPWYYDQKSVHVRSFIDSFREVNLQ